MTNRTATFPPDSLEYKLSRLNANERFALIQRMLGVQFVPHADFLNEVLARCGPGAAG
jgi:hypothetical protein